MYLGRVDVSDARTALFAEFLNTGGIWFGQDTPVASESPAALMAAGINPHAVGFRIYTRAEGVARVGDEGFRMMSLERIWEGPTHRIGRVVSLSYARKFVLIAASQRTAGDLGVLIGQAVGFEGVLPRILQFHGDHFQFIPDGDVVVDVTGRPVTDVLEDPVSP